MRIFIVGLLLSFIAVFGLWQHAEAGVTIAVESTNFTAAFNRLNSLGIETRPAVDAEGGIVKIENRIGTVNTPSLIGTNGLTYFSFRVPDDRVHVIPETNNPTFTVLWRSDRLECGTPELPEHCPWPEVEVDSFDEDGLPAGTEMRGVGRIQ